MSTFLSQKDKTIYIEDAVKQQKQCNKNQIGPYLTEKDRERAFYPSCRTDRFDWQKNNALFELNANKKTQDHHQDRSTEGKWNKLIMKTENDKISRRSMTPQSNSRSTSQRVLNPDLLGTPKFEGIKVYKNLVNDNWQKRRQDGHEKTLEMKHQKNIDTYIPNELIIPNTEGREKRDFSRLGRNEFSNRDQISQILIDKADLSLLNETSSVNNRQTTPSRCLYQKTHLQSGLVPTEERNEMQRINRSKSSKIQGSQLKNLLIDKSSDISSNINGESSVSISQSEKVSRKYTNKTQKSRIADEDTKFWKDMKQDNLWKEEIQKRNDNRYGKDCTREYILSQNPMHRDDFSNAFTDDFMSEKEIKADLTGIRNNKHKSNQTEIKYSANSKSPQPSRPLYTQQNNQPSKSPQQRQVYENHYSEKSPIRNGGGQQLIRSETHSNLSYKSNTASNNKQGFQSTSSQKPLSQLSKSPSANRMTQYQQYLSKSPIQERNYSSKSPSRYSSNNTNIIQRPGSVISQQSNNKKKEQLNFQRNNSKSPSQIGNRAPLSQINNTNNNNILQKSFVSQISANKKDYQQGDDQSIKSVVQNLFQEKFNYQNNKRKSNNDDKSDNYSILSYSVSQIGTNSQVQQRNDQSPFKQTTKHFYEQKDKKENQMINFGDSQSTISQISNAKSHKTQNQQNYNQNRQQQMQQHNEKENNQFQQTIKQRNPSKGTLSNRSQISSILHQL